jgi:hypothetical protein
VREQFEDVIMHGASGSDYADVVSEVNFHKYRQRMHLSYADAMEEPNEVVELAFLIWALEHERDKLEAERQRIKSQRQQ